MKNKIILISFLLASSSVFAGQDLVEGAAQQVTKDAATSVAPTAVEKTMEAGAAVGKAEDLKETIDKAPDAAKEKAAESAKEKLDGAKPDEVKQGEHALENGRETAEKLKDEKEGVSKHSDTAVKSIKDKVKTKARSKTAKKTMEMMH